MFNRALTGEYLSSFSTEDIEKQNVFVIISVFFVHKKKTKKKSGKLIEEQYFEHAIGDDCAAGRLCLASARSTAYRVSKKDVQGADASSRAIVRGAFMVV